MANINKLFSYIITDDTGFAPNPFWGVCSLACCKPIIRKSAEVGDWIVGIRGKTLYSRKTKKSSEQIYKIIYIFKVAEKLNFEEYFHSINMKPKNPILKNMIQSLSVAIISMSHLTTVISGNCAHSIQKISNPLLGKKIKVISRLI